MRWVCLPLLTLGALIACGPETEEDLSAADTDAIRAAAAAYNQLASDTAWSRWAETFTEDAVFLPPNTPAKEGRAAIEAWGRTFPPFRDLKLEMVDIIGRDDLAVVRGRYSLVMVIPGSPPAADSGKYIEVWRKQADASWKIYRDIFNSDLPLPAPAPAPGSSPP